MAHTDAHADHSHHIIPFRTLLGVFLALIALTVITVAVARVDLGTLNVPVAIAIASAKAALVVMFFMALKYDKPVNSMVFVIGTAFVVVFLVFTLFDTAFRGDIGNVEVRTISQERAEMERQQRAADAEQPQAVPADGEAEGGNH